MAFLIEHAGVTGMEIAVGVDDFRSRIGTLVIAAEHGRRFHEHFAIVGNFHFHAGRRQADAIELDIAIGLQANVSAGFRRAVQLLEVDADRTIKAEQVRADRRTGRVSDAHARQAQHVFQRAINGGGAKRILQPVEHADRFSIEDIGANATRHVHEMMEHLALWQARVFHADHHGREHVFKHARWREIIRRADLAQVIHDGVARFRAIDRKARHERLRIRKQVIADPGHRQVRQHIVTGGELVKTNAADCRRHHRAMRLAYAFWLAGRARCIKHDRHVIRGAGTDFIHEKVRMRAVIGASDFL